MSTSQFGNPAAQQDPTRQLAESLLQGRGIDHGCDDPQLLETHLSWVVLLGPFAYKLKKPLDLGFVDYSSLARRRHFCEEELRLNQRTAPDLYLAVVAIAGTPTNPIVGQAPDSPDVFEYAVKMRRFPQPQLLSQYLSRGELSSEIIIDLAGTIASFHLRLPPLFPLPFDLDSQIHGPARDNLVQLRDCLGGEPGDRLARISDWTEAEFRRRHGDFQQRHSNGHTRSCHGDLHLNNLLFDGHRCLLFDCIEFSQQLSWIDTASDLAFALMDLDRHSAEALSWQLLNEYLAITGDYGLLVVLAYYRSYRAMVRAKVLALQAGQSTDPGTRTPLLQRCNDYLVLAEGYARRPPVALVLVCGLSGSGKTYLARHLGPALALTHLRSDVERKRLFGLELNASSQAAGLDIYTAAAGERTLGALLATAESCLEAGYGVLVDATFSRRAWRGAFLALAARWQLSPVIVHCRVSTDTARKRLRQRRQDASEAGFAQYLDQQASWESFSEEEMDYRISISTEDPVAMANLARRVQAMLDRR